MYQEDKDMLQALKKVAGAVALAAFMVLGCMTAFADDEVQNPPSPHVVYQVFTDGQWKNEAMDKQSASDSASPVEGLKVWLTGVDGSISTAYTYTTAAGRAGFLTALWQAERIPGIRLKRFR